MSVVATTSRLRLRHAGPEDAAFIVELMNERAYHEYIGDRGVRTCEDGERYLREKYIGSYERNGFGLYVVETRTPLLPIGVCGLVKREGIADPDLGFAYLERFWSLGYGTEAARAVLDHARVDLAMPRVLGFVAPANAKSIRLLEKLGMKYDTRLVLPGQQSESLRYQI